MADEDPEVRMVRLNRLAKTLKQIYIERRTAVDKRPYRPHQRYDTIETWQKVATLCDRLNAGPGDFIAAQFRYRPGTIFANTLHGPTAEKNYHRYINAVYDGVKPSADSYNDNASDNTPRSPGIMEILTLLDDLKVVLQRKTNSTDTCTPEAVEAMLATPWHFNPLAVMLSAGHDSRIQHEFAKGARELLDNEPHLRAAIKKLDLDVNPIYEATSTI